jgi:hypothetical protein
MSDYNVSTLSNEVSSKALSQAAIDLLQVIESKELGKTVLSSNVGGVGMAPDYSNNMLTSRLQNEFPLVTWLMSTAMSTMLRTTASNGLASLYKDPDTGMWMIMLPYDVYTLPPIDTEGACCWVPIDIAKCAHNAPLNLLCLQDCDNVFDNLVNNIRTVGTNDLVGYFQRQGETAKQAKTRMAQLTMAFLTARNIILGVSDAATGVLKPFHGLLEVMENPAVIHIMGSNILSAFASLSCRLAVLADAMDGSDTYVFAAHPLVIRSIAEMVRPGQFGSYPDGWTKSADGTISFQGIRFIADKLVPIDLETGTGEVWMLNGDVLGVFMATDLVPGQNFVREQFAFSNDPDSGCATECTYYWNFGTVANSNPNKLAVISGIPISANCTDSLIGLENAITPDTLVPFI